MVREGIVRFDGKYNLIRVSKSNQSKEITWNEVKDRRYNEPYPNANASIGIIRISTNLLTEGF
jgi:hypothetical protein